MGLSTDASNYAGMAVKRTMALALTLSGAMCGLAGAMLVFGSISHRMVTDGTLTGFTGSDGYYGIVVALFGGLNPLWTILSAFLFGGLLVGGVSMGIALNVPYSSDLVTTIVGLIVCFVVSLDAVRRRSSLQAGPSTLRQLLTRRWPQPEAINSRDGPQPTQEATPADQANGGAAVSHFFTVAVFSATIASGIALGCPLLLAALGETVGQRSGVLNLGVDGIMLLGAFGAYFTALRTGNIGLGVLVGLGIGAVMGIDHRLHQRNGPRGAGHQRHRDLHSRAWPVRPAL